MNRRKFSRYIPLVAVGALLLSMSPALASSTVKLGANCNKVNAVSKIVSGNAICAKVLKKVNGKSSYKLIWIKKAATKTPTKAATTTPAAVTTTTAPVVLVPFKVALAFFKNVGYAGNWIADDSGMYASAGLAVTFLGGGPNAPAPEVSLATGEAVLAYESNTSRLFSYLSKANDIVIIGQRLQDSPNGLLSLAKRPVTNIRELKGARIIAGAPNRSSMAALMAINKVSKYQFVVGGADVGPLLAGQGDALLSFANNQPLILQAKGMVEGKDYFFTPFSALRFHVMSDVVIVNRAYLKSHRDQVVAFMAATIRGWKAQIEDPTKGATLAVKKYGVDLGLDLTQQIASAKADIPFMKYDGTKAHRIFQTNTALVRKYVYPGLELAGITGLPDASSVIDMSVLDDAYKLLAK